MTQQRVIHLHQMFMYTCERIIIFYVLDHPLNDMLSYIGSTLDVVPVNKETSTEKEESVVRFVQQFVKNVCDFSSQYGSNISISYTAYNIAGKPSKFPDYGDFPQAFVMVSFAALLFTFVLFTIYPMSSDFTA